MEHAVLPFGMTVTTALRKRKAIGCCVGEQRNPFRSSSVDLHTEKEVLSLDSQCLINRMRRTFLNQAIRIEMQHETPLNFGEDVSVIQLCPSRHRNTPVR